MATILTLAGDGIGPEIMTQAVDVLKAVNNKFELGLTLESGLIGGVAFDATGEPLPEETLQRARAADAVLLGAVGGPKWDGIESVANVLSVVYLKFVVSWVYLPICA